MNGKRTIAAAAMMLAGALAGQAQVASTKRIPIRKDVSTASGVYVPPDTTMAKDTVDITVTPLVLPSDTMPIEWYVATGTTCSTVDVSAAKAVSIKTNLYDPAMMITPDSAKIIALCAVPGQIGSGEMNMADGRTEYAIDIIPNAKKTHTKVIVDAQTGAVLSSKQFGGVRGLAGWVRESAEHKKNKNP